MYRLFGILQVIQEKKSFKELIVLNNTTPKVG
jgi:hypothetical protein